METEHTTEESIRRLRHLAPGEQYIYFVGFLDEDRARNPRGPSNQIAQIAYELMEEGRLILVQRRISIPMHLGVVDWKNGHGGGFEYIAVGSTPHQKKVRLFMLSHHGVQR